MSRPPSRFRLAFLNVWNGLALAATAGVAVVTKSPVPLLVGGALEGVWLTLASSPVISRKLFRSAYLRAEAAAAEERTAAALEKVSAADRGRYQRLKGRRESLLAAAKENRRFNGGLLDTEIHTVDDLVDSFLELAQACARWERHLVSVDFDDLESELRRAESDASQALDEDRRATARKNLSVLMQRRDGLADLRQRLAGARAQMELIENSFKLLTDQVMVMSNPRDIRARLDDLVVGVEAVREMTRDEGDPLRAAAAKKAIETHG